MAVDEDRQVRQRALGGRSRLAWQLISVVALAALSWFLVDNYGGDHRFFDLKIYRQAVRYWLAGGNVYDYWQPDVINGTLGFTYPPFAAVLMIPMGVLPYGLAQWTHVVLMSMCLAVIGFWLLAPPARRHKLTLWFVMGIGASFTLGLEPIRETFSFGQVNLMLAVMVIGDILFLVRRGSAFAGWGIGLATAIKLTPGIFIVYLFATRRYRAAWGSVAVAAGASIFAFIVDFRVSMRYWLVSLWDSGRVGQTDNISNQSVAGLFARLFDPDPAPSMLQFAALALVLGVGFWRAARAFRRGDEIVGITLTGLIGILLSPVSWIHHIVWVVPVLVVLLDVLATGWRTMSTGLRAWYASLTTVVYLAFTLGAVWWFEVPQGEHWDHGFWHMMGQNIYIILMIVLLIALPIRRDIDAVDMRRGNWRVANLIRYDESRV